MNVTSKKGACTDEKESIFNDIHFIHIYHCSCVFTTKEKIVETPQFLDVQLAVNPVQGNMNEVITFEAKVMYGDKEVTEPDEVTFEIWRANDNKHEKFDPKNKGNGLFVLRKKFFNGRNLLYICTCDSRKNA